MWNYFPIMLQKLTELPKYRGWNAPELMADLFPKLHYIWIVRRDKVRQAVSWAKAGQTNIYAWHKGELLPVPSQEPKFDFTFIDNLYNLILEGEAGWQTFFEASGVVSSHPPTRNATRWAPSSVNPKMLHRITLRCRNHLN